MFALIFCLAISSDHMLLAVHDSWLDCKCSVCNLAETPCRCARPSDGETIEVGSPSCVNGQCRYPVSTSIVQYKESHAVDVPAGTEGRWTSAVCSGPRKKGGGFRLFKPFGGRKCSSCK